jgi:mRNA interferase YafQ
VLNLKATSQFKRDFKKYKHDQMVIDELEKVVLLLRQSKKLPDKYRDHLLSNNWRGMKECHLKPDDLLIYFVSEETQTLYLERIGSHSELFR